ncbi:DNA-binding response regulator [Salinimicrobium soli]|uniref:DNA-binding response regulator n=1 Tax=Salinimicrobium soli TaxID=1254399 RepID=UPI003AAC9425
MFKKVLVAEDMDSVNHAVASVLKDLNIPEVQHAQYCDQAQLLAKKAIQEGAPFDLLICDLSFKNDHREEKITSGQELISILKNEDPSLKVLVNSVEDHPQTVRSMWNSGNIDAYVCKDRNGMKDLKSAILSVAEGGTYNSPRIQNTLQQKNLLMLNNFEVQLLSGVANGLTQKQIEDNFKKKNISPSSKSAIEKRLKELREEFGANTTPHLIGIVKDLKLI